jgi:hypothetical protein
LVLKTPLDTAYSEYIGLGVSVSPSGNSFKLWVNETQTFVTPVLNDTAPFTYTWSINPSGNFTLLVNGEETQVSNGSALTVGDKS